VLSYCSGVEMEVSPYKVIYLNIIDLMLSMLIYKHKVYQSKFVV